MPAKIENDETNLVRDDEWDWRPGGMDANQRKSCHAPIPPMRVVWSSDSYVGPNGSYYLAIQNDGNLVIYNAGETTKADWETRHCSSKELIPVRRNGADVRRQVIPVPCFFLGCGPGRRTYHFEPSSIDPLNMRPNDIDRVFT